MAAAKNEKNSTPNGHADHLRSKLFKRKEASETSSSRKRAKLFDYPSLPEIKLCFIVTFATIAYAWYCVYVASQEWISRVDTSAIPKSWIPLVGYKHKDNSNWEWLRWSPFALKYLPLLAFHTVVFNVADLVVRESIWVPWYTLVSMIISAYVFSAELLVCSLIQGVFIFACTAYFRKTMVVWISSIPMLYMVMNETRMFSTDPFLLLIFVPYTLLSFVSFNLEMLRGNISGETCDHLNPKTIVSLLQKMFFYAFYQPYLFSLIVLYPDFDNQFKNRRTKVRNWRKIISVAAKIAFWWIAIELMQHFLYFNFITQDPSYAERIPKNQLVSIGMAIGAFFHLKYVVIFGLPALFALIDNMQPPDGPICINRVSLYSKIWRGFDRGLYAFFKTYIFTPICWPTFSFQRKLFGICVSFTFVLIWHGFQHHNVIWILLNIAELFVEFGSKAVYSLETVGSLREKTISNVNFRRTLGALHIFPFAIGLYSNFYFLGGSKIGWIFVKRIFLEETITVRWPFLLLIFLGYFYMQVAMEVERKATEQPLKCPITSNEKISNGKKHE